MEMRDALALILGLLAAFRGWAQFHPLSMMPPASEDVSVSFYYPNHDGHGSKLPVNDVVTVLCHFSNEGESTLNVTAAMGSLNMAHDFNFYVQNFTFKPVGLVLPPNEEMTFSYEFIMDPRLDTTQDYTLAHSVFYENVAKPEDWYTSTFFNSTVELYTTEAEVDLESIVMIIGALIGTVFTVGLAFYACFPDEKSRRSIFGSSTQKRKFD